MQKEFRKQVEQKLNRKDARTVLRAIEAVEDYLPKDVSSPWPKELRYYLPRTATTLVAWDGTVGASVRLGTKLELLVAKAFKRTPPGWATKQIIYSLCNYPKFFKEPEKFDTKNLQEKFMKGFMLRKCLRIGGEIIFFSGQDLIKMLHTASKLRSKEIRAVAMDQYPVRESDFRIVAFEVSPGIYVHIVGKCH